MTRDPSLFPPSPRSTRRRRFSTRRSRTLLLLGLLLLLSLLLHRPLLRLAADLWIVEGPPFDRADLAIVPGGGLETRPFGAASDWREGKVSRIATFRVRTQPAMAMGLQPSDADVALAILEKEGVPADRIDLIGDEVASTWDEVRATRDWCEQHGIRSVVVYTEIFPSRRVRRSYRRALAPLGVAVHVVAMDPALYHDDNWWQTEDGILQFQNEILKSVYYRVKGR